MVRQVGGEGLVGGSAAAVRMDDGTTLHATRKTVDGLEMKDESAPLWTEASHGGILFYFYLFYLTFHPQLPETTRPLQSRETDIEILLFSVPLSQVKKKS